MSQSAADKEKAIASVVWLLPHFYTMLRLSPGGDIQYVNEMEGDPDMPGWAPPTVEEFADFPARKFQRWFAYQRFLAAKYRLRDIGRAFDQLQHGRPELAAAVRAQLVEIPTPNWYEPKRVDARCRGGLKLMAREVSGRVPEFGPDADVDPKTLARNRRIWELHHEGVGVKKIAKEMGCSPVTVRAELGGGKVRHGRIIRPEEDSAKSSVELRVS
jgi:hypothetical protein